VANNLASLPTGQQTGLISNLKPYAELKKSIKIENLSFQEVQTTPRIDAAMKKTRPVETSIASKIN
jgi:hypothetical protein